MKILTKVDKQAMTKGFEKAKAYFQKKGHDVAHPPKQHAPKEHETMEKPAVKELNQESLTQAAKEGKSLQKNGVTAHEHQQVAPPKTTGDNTSEQHRAIQQDKPAYDPKIPKQRDQAKANDKGLSH